MVKKAVLVVFFTCFLVKVHSKIIVKARNLECFPNAEWMNMTCKLRAISWQRSLLNVEAELKKDVNRLMIHLQTFKRYNTYQPFPMNVSLEVCSLLRGTVNNNIFAVPVHQMINKFSNFNHTCPYHKGEKVIVKDLDLQQVVDFMNLNLVGGDGRYRSDVNFCRNGEKSQCTLVVSYSDYTEG